MIPERLLAAAQTIDPEPIAELTLELLRIWSPPGDEAAMADRVAEALVVVGAHVRLDEEVPGSPSVIAELGEGDGPTLQWHGHLDAIDVPQGEPRREGDRLLGRGAADMKGPLASFVAAARLLRDHGLPERGRILVTFHGRHESGGNEPLHALIARGIHGDAVITGELGGGTELPVGALGLTFWEIVVDPGGEGVHEVFAGRDTVDPLLVAHRLLDGLRDIRRRLTALDPGPEGPSLFVGQIAGGDYPNRVAARVVLQGTRRHTVAERLADVGAELEAMVADVRAETGAPIDLRVRPIAEAYATPPGEPLIAAALDAHRALTGVTLPLTHSRVVSNAVHFVEEAGIPAVCYGPDPRTNHGDHESITVPELARLAGGFALISAAWLARATTGASAEAAPVADRARA